MSESTEKKRSLYECFNAKVLDENIHCSKGHKLSDHKDGMVSVRSLARGKPLVLSACQECPDFDRMGDPLPKEERGWVKKT